MDIKELAIALANGEAPTCLTTEPRAKRMKDRLYRLTVTYPDGKVTTEHCSHNQVSYYRRWYRKNYPSAQVTFEEVETLVSADGEHYHRLSFTSQPTLKHAEGGTYTHSNIKPKETVQATFPWDVICEVRPAFLWTEQWTKEWKPRSTKKVAEINAEARAKRAYDAKLTKDNGKMEEDRNIRFYLNSTGNLILSTDDVRAAVKFLRDNNLSAKEVTTYMPRYLYATFMRIVGEE